VDELFFCNVNRRGAGEPQILNLGSPPSVEPRTSTNPVAATMRIIHPRPNPVLHSFLSPGSPAASNHPRRRGAAAGGRPWPCACRVARSRFYVARRAQQAVPTIKRQQLPQSKAGARTEAGDGGDLLTAVGERLISPKRTRAALPGWGWRGQGPRPERRGVGSGSGGDGERAEVETLLPPAGDDGDAVGIEVEPARVGWCGR